MTGVPVPSEQDGVRQSINQTPIENLKTPV